MTKCSNDLPCGSGTNPLHKFVCLIFSSIIFCAQQGGRSHEHACRNYGFTRDRKRVYAEIHIMSKRAGSDRHVVALSTIVEEVVNDILEL